MANEVRILVTAVDKATKTLFSIQNASSQMGEAIRKSTMIGGAALVGLGGVSLKFASDLSESMNKVDVVFGDSADAVKEFSKTAARELGVSQARALEATGTFGNLFVTMGLGQEDAANMSTELATLASDLASFNNIDPTEALEKLRAGLVGEVEPLRTVGVALNAAAVEAEAMRLGLVAAGEEMTEADKVQARYSLILQQTTTAQGDFARTADGMANGTRILRAQLEDLAAKMGTVLLPIAEKVLNTLIDKLDDLAIWFEANRPQIEAALEEISRVFMNFAGTFKRGLEVVLPALGNFAEFIYSNKPLLIAAIAAIGAAIVIAFGPVSLAIVAITGIITAIGYLRDNWRDVGNAIIGIVEDMVNGIVGGLNKAIDKIGDFLEMVRKIPGLGDILGLGGMTDGQIFEGGTIGEVSLGRIGAAASSLGDMWGTFEADAAERPFKNLAEGLKETTAAIGNDGLTGAVGGAKAAAASLTDAEKDLAATRADLFRALSEIQDTFMHDQIAAYLEGGEEQVAAVKAQQELLRVEIDDIAQELRQVFGISVPESLRIAMDHVMESSEALLSKAEENHRRIMGIVAPFMASNRQAAREQFGEQGVGFNVQGVGFGIGGIAGSAEEARMAIAQMAIRNNSVDQLPELFTQLEAQLAKYYGHQITVNGDVYGYEDFQRTVADGLNQLAISDGPVLSSGVVA